MEFQSNKSRNKGAEKSLKGKLNDKTTKPKKPVVPRFSFQLKLKRPRFKLQRPLQAYLLFFITHRGAKYFYTICLTGLLLITLFFLSSGVRAVWLYRSAEILARQANTAEAIALMDECIYLNPTEGRYYLKLIDYYQQRLTELKTEIERTIIFTRIEQRYRQLTEIYPYNWHYREEWAKLKLTLANQYNLPFERDLAIDMIRALSEAEPNNIQILTHQADFWKTLGEPSRALEIYEKIVTLLPQSAEAWIALVTLYRQRGDNLKAWNAAQYAWALVPGNKESQSLLYNHYEDIGKSALKHNYRVQAKVQYEKALTYDPKGESALLGLAEILFREEDYPGSMAMLGKLAQINPMNKGVSELMQKINRVYGSTNTKKVNGE